MTNLGHDRTQLEPMALKALAATGCEELTALADRGYFNGRCWRVKGQASFPAPQDRVDERRRFFSRHDK